MKLAIKGDVTLVHMAAVVPVQCGWELKVSRSARARADLSAGTCIRGASPVQVVFDVIPDDWHVHKRTSSERAAAVVFTAETAEEAAALNNLSPVQRSQSGFEVTRLAMRAGYTWRDVQGFG